MTALTRLEEWKQLLDPLLMGGAHTTATITDKTQVLLSTGTINHFGQYRDAPYFTRLDFCFETVTADFPESKV